jgi:hypothetical protein
MTHSVIPFCSAALAVMLASALSAQTPMIQSPAAVRQYTGTVATPAQQIATLQQTVARLQQQVAALEAKTSLLASDGQSLVIQAPLGVTIKSGQQFTLTAPMGSITSSANLAITAGMVNINGGGMPAARVGDPVNQGAITNGSATVLIGH